MLRKRRVKMITNKNEFIEEISKKRNEIDFSFDEISNLLEKLISIAHESKFHNNEIGQIERTIKGYITGIKMKQNRISTIYQLIR
jgi:hypothetical protein